MLYRMRASKLSKNGDDNEEVAHYEIPIKIRRSDDDSDDWTEGTAIIDTGCQMGLWLPKKLYEKMGGKVCSQKNTTVIDGSSIKHDVGTVNLRIGDKNFPDTECSLTDADFTVIGIPVISQFDLTIKDGRAHLKAKD
ncbi:MAG TPA: hypothetical protein VJB59_05020 [Bdellovibrionota bacterium]|nr:hypothetical protein [Bdellovibrionota bacterium]